MGWGAAHIWRLGHIGGGGGIVGRSSPKREGLNLARGHHQGGHGGQIWCGGLVVLGERAWIASEGEGLGSWAEGAPGSHGGSSSGRKGPGSLKGS
ncbi:hypothetical protein TIFTF001_046847 [Ficus carica]|uniref:Uncharacterized protein n=1 Tax=Ficus carica TaxID=3494 RepID=A0AA87YQ01_FICCA|nr:hypothetical protein TIFTF001_046847 [Ficus carica]